MRVIGFPYLRLSENSTVIIGDNFEFSNGYCYNPLCRNIRGCIKAEYGAQVIIGDSVGLSSVCIWAKSKIQIQSNSKIGGGTILLDSDCHSLDWKIRSSNEIFSRNISMDSFFTKSAPIKVGYNVLVGANCIVLKGVTIGDQSIIAAGSVVTKDIPANCIAGGNPCKVIRFLDDKN